MSAAPVVSRIRVRYAETDQMGVVYYANYYVWFEVGRTDLLRSAGGSYRDMEKDGLQLPVKDPDSGLGFGAGVDAPEFPHPAVHLRGRGIENQTHPAQRQGADRARHPT